MIKEKLTPELKKLFRDTIKKTMNTGLEHGFLLCLDDKDNLIPSRVCKGEECKVELPQRCSIKTQGNFHTHPLLAYYNKELEKMGSKKLFSRKDLLKTINDLNKIGTIKFDPQSPSKGDALTSLIDKCQNTTNGTVCIGNDLIEKIECWTAKQIPREDCATVNKEFSRLSQEEKTGQPEQRIKDLFYTESIDVRKTFIESY